MEGCNESRGVDFAGKSAGPPSLPGSQLLAPSQLPLFPLTLHSARFADSAAIPLPNWFHPLHHAGLSITNSHLLAQLILQLPSVLVRRPHNNVLQEPLCLQAWLSSPKKTFVYGYDAQYFRLSYLFPLGRSELLPLSESMKSFFCYSLANFDIELLAYLSSNTFSYYGANLESARTIANFRYDFITCQWKASFEWQHD